MLALSDNKTAVVADPETDQVWIVDTSTLQARAVALQPHDEPGRMVEDGTGNVHVLLRGGGAVATIDPAAAAIVSVRAICPAPRGIAFDATTNQVHVACAGGELISLPAIGVAPTRRVQLDVDLRDVLVASGTLFVTRFRSAELLTLDADGNVIARRTPANYSNEGSSTVFTPSVAWRTIVMPDGRIAMLHQRGSTDTLFASGSDPHVPPKPDGGAPGALWGGVDGPCGANASIVHTAVTLFDVAGTAPPSYPPIQGAALGIDLAASADATQLFIASLTPETWPADQPLIVSSLKALRCDMVEFGSAFVGGGVAVATLGDSVLVQARAPSKLYIRGPLGTVKVVSLSTSPPDPPGFQLFHRTGGVGVACASCHPEGGDDGRVWHFDIGDRRTIPLRGGLRGTEPLHWNGDESDLPALLNDVFTDRMYGPAHTCEERETIADWLDSIRPVAPSVDDADAVGRGQALFEDPSVGCATCHSGPHLTNNQTVDVGTGGAFQVPRLHGVGLRPPFLHDGRAATLRERFGPGGGGDSHGQTSQLTSAQIDDLVAYLKSL